MHLCGHLALTNSCPDPQISASSASADASVVQRKDPWSASRVGQICHEIIETCGASSVAPSNIECHQLLSGMNDAGRERTRACMKAHCFDRGLVGVRGGCPRHEVGDYFVVFAVSEMRFLARSISSTRTFTRSPT